MTDDLKAPETDDIKLRLRGRAAHLYDRGEIKSPSIMIEAADLHATLEAALADMTRQRDRQYDENVSLIAKQAATEAERDAAMAGAVLVRDGYRVDVFDLTMGGRSVPLHRALTPDLAALSRIEAQAEARGMRKAAGVKYDQRYGSDWLGMTCAILALAPADDLAAVEALRKRYDDLYQDAISDAKSDAQEFEGELWKMIRDYLTELEFDWSGDVQFDGVTADEAMQYIRECMDGETRRAEAAESILADAGALRDAADRVSAWFATEARHLEGPRINGLRMAMVAYDRHMQPAPNAAMKEGR